MIANKILGLGLLAGGGYLAYDKLIKNKDNSSTISSGFVGSGGVSRGVVARNENTGNSTTPSDTTTYNYNFPSPNLKGFYNQDASIKQINASKKQIKSTGSGGGISTNNGVGRVYYGNNGKISGISDPILHQTRLPTQQEIKTGKVDFNKKPIYSKKENKKSNPSFIGNVLRGRYSPISLIGRFI